MLPVFFLNRYTHVSLMFFRPEKEKKKSSPVSLITASSVVNAPVNLESIYTDTIEECTHFPLSGCNLLPLYYINCSIARVALLPLSYQNGISVTPRAMTFSADTRGSCEDFLLIDFTSVLAGVLLHLLDLTLSVI